ncbi:CHC2 zinc finger domain-containing protein [Segniliparus rugosus]|uniref:CHC2 zinc finger domain-containing protein n=1 Tax=Segniliparus rugosus TaxID=286804 RepID=UPI000A04E5C3
MSLIAEVITHYFPEWEPPADRGHEWARCLCPFHGEDNPSAAVSYRLEAFNCLACGMKGDAIGIVMKHKEVSYSRARRIVEEIGGQIPSKPAGEPRRGVSEKPWAGLSKHSL